MVEGEIEHVGGSQLEYGDGNESTLLNENKLMSTDRKQNNQQQ